MPSFRLNLPWDRRALAFSGLALGICFATALLSTWPLPLHLSSAIPLGIEEADTVPLFSLYSLWWVAERAAHGFVGLWDAPFFYPYRGVFTFSEPLTLTGLGSAPLWAVGAPPALAYNLALLGSLTLNGAFTVRLARALDAPPLPSLLAGVLGVTLPFAAKMHGELAILPCYGLLASLDGLVRFSKSGAPRHAAMAGLGLVAQFLCGQQMALLGAPLIALGGVLALLAQRRDPRALLYLALGGLGAGILVYLLARPALAWSAHYGFVRDEEIVTRLSAVWQDFFSRPANALLSLPPREELKDYTGGSYPGLFLAFLALSGTVDAWKQRQQRRWALFLLAGVALEVVLALGMNVELGSLRPFALLRARVPGFAFLRSPFRAAELAQMLLPPLAAIGIHGLYATSQRRGARTLAIALALLAAAENLGIPAPLTDVPRSPVRAWTTWLRAHPEQRALVHLPMTDSPAVEAFAPEVWRMFAQLDHRRPIFNGYSGHFPPDFLELGQTMKAFPRADLLCTLSRAGIDTLVVDQPWLASRREAFAASPSLSSLYGDAEVQLYRLTPSSACAPNTAPPR